MMPDILAHLVRRTVARQRLLAERLQQHIVEVAPLPLHVLRRIGTATLQRNDVINHVSRTVFGRQTRCGTRMRLLEGMARARIVANPAARRPLTRRAIRRSVTGPGAATRRALL